MEDQLQTVAKGIEALTAAGHRATHADVPGGDGAAQRRDAAVSTSRRAFERRLSSADLERIERILVRLDEAEGRNAGTATSTGASTGHTRSSGASHSTRASVRSCQRSRKARLRTIRNNARRGVIRSATEAVLGAHHGAAVGVGRHLGAARAMSDRSRQQGLRTEEWQRSGGPQTFVAETAPHDGGDWDHSKWDGSDWDDNEAEADPNAKRFYLEIDDDIERAPSIGQRTADRLRPHSIGTVRDLLAADAADLAERVNARHITAQRIEDWQMQARLVCTVPWLRGTHAQLLVGAGYTTPGDICEASPDALSADILKFSATRDGQRILRSGPPPELEKILRWAEFAAQAELERAA